MLRYKFAINSYSPETKYTLKCIYFAQTNTRE